MGFIWNAKFGACNSKWLLQLQNDIWILLILVGIRIKNRLFSIPKVFLIARPRISLASNVKTKEGQHVTRWVIILWNKFWSVDVPSAQENYSNKGVVYSKQWILVWLWHASCCIIKIKSVNLNHPRRRISPAAQPGL